MHSPLKDANALDRFPARLRSIHILVVLVPTIPYVLQGDKLVFR